MQCTIGRIMAISISIVHYYCNAYLVNLLTVQNFPLKAKKNLKGELANQLRYGNLTKILSGLFREQTCVDTEKSMPRTPVCFCFLKLNASAILECRDDLNGHSLNAEPRVCDTKVINMGRAMPWVQECSDITRDQPRHRIRSYSDYWNWST